MTRIILLLLACLLPLTTAIQEASTATIEASGNIQLEEGEDDCENQDNEIEEEFDECEGCLNMNTYWNDIDDDDDDEWPEGYEFDWAGYNEDVHDYDHIFEGLDCPEILFDDESPPRPIHTPETWTKLRQVYLDVMGTNASITEAQLTGNSFLVPIQVQITEGKGRGVYAKEFIPKGTKIYESHVYTAMFYTGERFRKFLELIDIDLACDVLIWAYVEWKDDDLEDQLILAFDIDEGSFTNGAMHRSEINVNVDYVAARDIQPGEELIESYDDFSIADGFTRFGL